MHLPPCCQKTWPSKVGIRWPRRRAHPRPQSRHARVPYLCHSLVRGQAKIITTNKMRLFCKFEGLVKNNQVFHHITQYLVMFVNITIYIYISGYVYTPLPFPIPCSPPRPCGRPQAPRQWRWPIVVWRAPQALRMAPGPTAVAVSHCGSGGPYT